MGEKRFARQAWRALVGRGDSLFALRVPLTSRGAAVELLAERACGADDRSELAERVAELFAGAWRRRVAPARLAVYTLNLVLLHVVLSPLCSARDIGVEDWPKLAMFWKSQLSDEDWRALVKSLQVRWDGLPDPLLVLRPATVDGRTSLRDAVAEARFVGDSVGSAFGLVVDALPPSRYDVHYARAVVQLAASPVDPWERAGYYAWWADKYPDLVLECLRRDVTVSVEALRELTKTPLGESSAFVVQLCDRIGRGGDDEGLLDVVDGLGLPRVDRGAEIAMLDAWLRLHEQGYRHPSHRRVDLRAVVRAVDFEMVQRLRPDLVYRCGTVAHEIGLFE